MNEKGIYLILGASSDVGIGLIQVLNETQKDSTFLCHYRSNIDELEKISLDNGNKIKFIQADLSKNEEVYELIREIKENYGVPSYIVHLPASKFEYTKLKKFEWEQFQEDLEIQVHSLIEILKEFLPLMLKKEIICKVVIMLTSYTISNPPKFMMSYIMTKYALLGMMKSLAADYAGKKIRINGISPTMIDTKFLENISSKILELNAQESVGGRNATVMDIVPAIKFLLSSDSDYMHGVNLNITNGNIIG